MEMEVSQVGCFQNYELLNMLLHFFIYLIYSVFHETFVKKFMKKLSFFSSNFKNPFSICSIVQKITRSNLVMLKWRPFEYKLKVQKIFHFWGCFFRNKKMLTFLIFMNQTFPKWFLISQNDIYGSTIVEITGRQT